MPINASWHLKHKMPKNPTEQERVRWHVAHAKHCACRKMSPALLALVRKHRRQPSSTVSNSRE